MRSVRVVLPESMWALMPMLRILAMSLLMDRSLSTFHACRDVRGLTGAEASGCAEIEQSDRYYSRKPPLPQVRGQGMVRRFPYCPARFCPVSGPDSPCQDARTRRPPQKVPGMKIA